MSIDLFTGTSADPNPTATSLSDRTIFQTKFNQVQYEVELWLDGGGGDSTSSRLYINPNAVINLTIGDTLADWTTTGTLTLMHSPEGNAGINESTAAAGVDSYKSYVFRNDGLDLLRIRMKPLLSPKNGLGYSVDDEKFWTLSFLFSIYDREEIDMPQGTENAASNKIKALKLHFWDCWFQRLSTRIVQFSTALSVSPAPTIDPTMDNGTQGVLRTGHAIKQIIDLGLSENPNQASYTGNSFPDSSISPAGVNLQYNVTKNIGADFDIGSANIFYTAPANTTAYDSLMYLYHKHVSSAQIASSSGAQPPRGGRAFSNQIFDFCILNKEKGPDPESVGQLTLKPMSTFFEKAGNGETSPGEYQIEHFFLQSYFDQESISATYKAPKGPGTGGTVDLSSPGYSYISNFRFVDIAALINSKEFCNRPVHSFDFRARTLNIEYGNNSVLTARKFIADKYINKVYKKGGDNEKLFLVTLESEKKDRNFKPIYSPDGDNPNIRQSIGLQKLLKLGVFENAAINFRTLGLPFRETGRFIAIDKIQGSESGEFEDKFYGQWFIIDIKHIFEAEIYYNDITAVKIHRFDTLPINLTGTI
jgi:hypothetical protein